ncbi:type II secretion system protein [Humisphaera borealis]|uniref:Prepilin-type N-terminal cleavage/methylation domain-containing protein n=1 Tax=Humisphaera borealis TaxID=2807512 RepID=A0A7M2X5Y6_9BACT|nr:hypothetical protein [Humisphaera borealis]QOV92220.1 hypothetical protein IPV69_13030 [Humisphaera borealis]
MIELLVVIGILVLLVSILLPTVSAARYKARLTTCVSNLRQISIAVNAFAIEHEGKFPTLDMPSTGANLWDVPFGFYDVLRKQGVPHSAFICPAAHQEPEQLEAGFDRAKGFYILNYNVWIPRQNGSNALNILPPPPTYTGAKFVIVNPRPTETFAGPANMADERGIRNPIISDIVGSEGSINPPANADLTADGNPYRLHPITNHRNGDKIHSINLGFADGHVETKRGNEIRPYFRGNWWNWR